MEAVQEEHEQKAALFDWLVSRMAGHSLHMDGTQWWSLPCGTLSKYPSRTPQEAIQAAYNAHKSWEAKNLQPSPQAILGAQK